MDVVSAIAGQKHCNSIVVTASVDNISFRSPIRLGNVVTLRAKVTRSFNSSVEIRIDVEAENIPEGKKIESNSTIQIPPPNPLFVVLEAVTYSKNKMLSFNPYPLMDCPTKPCKYLHVLRNTACIQAFQIHNLNNMISINYLPASAILHSKYL